MAMTRFGSMPRNTSCTVLEVPELPGTRYQTLRANLASPYARLQEQARVGLDSLRQATSRGSGALDLWQSEPAATPALDRLKKALRTRRAELPALAGAARSEIEQRAIESVLAAVLSRGRDPRAPLAWLAAGLPLDVLEEELGRRREGSARWLQLAEVLRGR